jgi:hypothetical protein
VQLSSASLADDGEMATTLSYLSKNTVDDDDPVLEHRDRLGRYTTTYLPPTVPTVYRHLRVSPPLLPPRRLYEFFILDWNVQFRNELEYFCCVQDTPAILFKFHELEARPKVFEETPEWAKRVKPFDEIFTYPIKTVKR